ncbi:MAG TPA: UbiH/UbiF family hydroxylase [Pusillimonas sp.]|uniref:UbiH/UbiF family hydroxylase n=1 Tax=Pusillimonas sp. TaxID=3040095 RepID=UPI002B4B28CD|nr:UbiH/UbiF family hydroxylase [Pusillimonas sp.]HLU20030.1 UbiH/UbiF family hydroxylase [Pusillimonas sp.]
MSTNQIIVCGTGIVGLAAALGLARQQEKVLLLGPRKPPEPAQADVYFPRVYALSAESKQFLERLGVWDLLDFSRVTPVESMQVYGDASGYVDLRAWQAVQPEMAWIIESSEIERVLHQGVKMFGVSWHDDRFQSLTAHAVKTESGRQLEAALVIGADGADSPVRAAAGISGTSKPYGQMGVVTHLTAERPHGHAAVQWFTSDSVLALLPMPDTADGPQVSMVWSMSNDRAQALLALPQAERQARLELDLLAATEGALGRLTVRSGVFAFPLFLERSSMVAPGVALAGDAAHRVHPLAGQGLNLGLGDVAQLLGILKARPQWCSPGQISLLRRYRRVRAEPVMAMSLVTDGLFRLFASHSAPMVVVRNLGMRLVDRMPFIKRQLIVGASGERSRERGRDLE